MENNHLLDSNYQQQLPSPLKSSPFYQPLSSMTALFNSTQYNDKNNYDPYALPLSAKDLGVQDRPPAQPSLVPRNMALRTVVVNKLSSPLLRSSSSGSLSSNGTYSSNNSTNNSTTTQPTIRNPVVQTNSFMRPRSEKQNMQLKDENHGISSDEQTTNNDTQTKLTPSSKRGTGSRTVTRHHSMPSRYTTVPDLAPRPGQLNANRTADHQQNNITSKPIPIVNNASNLYVRSKHTNNKQGGDLVSPSDSSLKSESNGTHIKYVSLTSNGYMTGQKTSPTLRNSKPHWQSSVNNNIQVPR